MKYEQLLEEAKNRTLRADLDAQRISSLQNVGIASQYQGSLQNAAQSNLTAAAMQQNMANSTQAMNAIYGGLANNANQAGQYLTTNGITAAWKDQEIDPNNEAALVVPLSALIDLWNAAHGDKWISQERINKEAGFWSAGMPRLLRMRILEQSGTYVRMLEERFWKF